MTAQTTTVRLLGSRDNRAVWIRLTGFGILHCPAEGLA